MSKALGGLIFGIILGYILHIPANEKVCAIIFLAALDAIFGGIDLIADRYGGNAFHSDRRRRRP